jgi:hypothetical protein
MPRRLEAIFRTQDIGVKFRSVIPRSLVLATGGSSSEVYPVSLLFVGMFALLLFSALPGFTRAMKHKAQEGN